MVKYKRVNLLVDIDEFPEDVIEFISQLCDRMQVIDCVMGTVFTGVQVRKTKRGLHLKFEVAVSENFDEKDTVICQMALGSDYKRELFNWRRVRGGNPPENWNVLYKRKWSRTIDGIIRYTSEEAVTALTQDMEREIMLEYISRKTGEAKGCCKEIIEQLIKEKELAE